jgi:hypothetical protein
MYYVPVCYGVVESLDVMLAAMYECFEMKLEDMDDVLSRVRRK